MKIAIIGAGLTGLSAAYQLTKKGHRVTILEKESHAGGLAFGYKEKKWNWSLEAHYHHWFTNDTTILSLAKEIHHPVIIRRPKTSVFVDNKLYPFDSPKDILLFPKLSLLDTVRMGLVGGLLKCNPFWKPLEKINATTFLPKTMGKRAYQMIWEPQFVNKFGEYAQDISLSWLWARLYKRTFSLAYPQGGFANFIDHLAQCITQKNGTIIYNASVEQIIDKNQVTLTYRLDNTTHTQTFDKVIFTLSTVLFTNIAHQLPQRYKDRYKAKKGLGATNLILRLQKPFFQDTTYWASICDKAAPVMAVVEHTNFMDKKQYNNESIVYLGNYMKADSKRFAMDKETVLQLYDPFLKKLNPDYKKNLIDYTLFKSPFAQPIIPTNYSKKIPPMQTPLPHVVLANMEQVYPWDRGTNYAVQLGEKAATFVVHETQ